MEPKVGENLARLLVTYRFDTTPVTEYGAPTYGNSQHAQRFSSQETSHHGGTGRPSEGDSLPTVPAKAVPEWPNDKERWRIEDSRLTQAVSPPAPRLERRDMVHVERSGPSGLASSLVHDGT